MQNIIHVIRSLVLALLVLAGFVPATPAQEVSIPDPGLNAAIREALQKPTGPLTEPDLLGLTNLDAGNRNISSVAGLEAARNLTALDLDFNQLRSLNLPASLTNLSIFEVLANQLTNLTIPAELTSLSFIDADANQLPNFTLPAGLTRLTFLHLNGNQLTSFSLPTGLTNLTGLSLAENQLTNLLLPTDLARLAEIDLGENQLASFTFPSGLTRLTSVDLDGNQLTMVTVSPDATNLTSLFVDGNPLTTFVVSEPMAATNLAALVASLQNRGVSVFTYPLAAQLVRPLTLVGAFKIGITGPPGVYTVLVSTNLAAWTELGVATNQLGAVNFTDATAHLAPPEILPVALTLS